METGKSVLERADEAIRRQSQKRCTHCGAPLRRNGFGVSYCPMAYHTAPAAIPTSLVVELTEALRRCGR